MTRPAPYPAPAGPWPSRLACLVLILAAVLRAPYAIMPIIDADMAMWGVQALDIMQGRWHFLFSGELFGGNLEAWLAVPLFWLFGASAGTLVLVPAGLSLVLVWAVWRLGRAELGDWAGLAAMAWAGLGPFYLIWQSVEPKGGYIEVPLLAVLCLGLSLRLARDLGRPGGRPGLWAFLLGLLAGLGLWTHLLMLPAILACALYLVVLRPGLLLSRHLPLALAGLALGGLPLWLISLPAGLLGGDVLSAGRELHLGPAWRDLWTQGLPLALGLMPAKFLPSPALWQGLRLGLWLVYGLALGSLLWFWRGRVFGRQEGRGSLAGLTLLYLAVYLATWLQSGAHSQETWRHLSPLYAGLPLFFGAAVAVMLERGWRWPALTLTALVLAFHLAGNWLLTPINQPGEWANHQERRRQERELMAWLEAEGHRHPYAQRFWDALPLTLASGGRVTFADQIENHFPRHLRLADADPKPAYVLTTRAVDFALDLEIAGIKARRTSIGRFTVFDHFACPAPALREVPPQGWLSPMDHGQRAWDRDISTRWTTGEVQRKGQRFVLDLGQAWPEVCRLAIMPGNFFDDAGGLTVRVSSDGQTWRMVARHWAFFAPLHWDLDRPLIRFLPARRQIDFPPQEVRFIEMVQERELPPWWWSLAEVFVYRADGPAPAPAPPSPAELAQAPEMAQATGPVYAPPQVLAILPPGRAGVHDPQLPPRGGLPFNRLDMAQTPGAALCLPLADWPASQALLETHLGRRPQARVLGDHVLVAGLQAAWREREMDLPEGAHLEASDNPQVARDALDRVHHNAWHSGAPQRPGQWAILDLGREVELGGLVLESGAWPENQPAEVSLALSRDGRDWRPAEGLTIARGRLAWDGQGVITRDGPYRLRFRAQAARWLRLELVRGDPTRQWSIAEVRLLTPEGQGARQN